MTELCQLCARQAPGGGSLGASSRQPQQEQAVRLSAKGPKAPGAWLPLSLRAQRHREDATMAAYLSEQSPSSSSVLPACGCQHWLHSGWRSRGGDPENHQPRASCLSLPTGWEPGCCAILYGKAQINSPVLLLPHPSSRQSANTPLACRADPSPHCSSTFPKQARH